MYQRPEPLIPDGYSGTALRGENLQPPPPPPPCVKYGQEDLLLLVLLLLVVGEGVQNDRILALILAALLLLGRGDPGRSL